MKTFLALLFAALLSAPALAGPAPNYNPPFGMWRIPTDQLGTVPYNLTALAFDPSTDTAESVLTALDKARAAKMHVFISLVNFADLSQMPGRYQLWCPNGKCLNLQPYVQDGTLLGLHIFEYNAVGRNHIVPPGTPSIDLVQQTGKAVKKLWPYLLVAIDTSHPCAISPADVQGTFDIVLITFFTIRQNSFGSGDAVIQADAQCAKDAGLKFTLGPNPFGGLQHGMTSTSLANFTHYIEYALTYPGSMGTFIWRWWPSTGSTVTNGRQTFANFWSNSTDPGVSSAMQEIQACAARRTTAACPHATE